MFALLQTKDYFAVYCANGTLFTLATNGEETVSARIEWAEELARNFVRQINLHYIDSYTDTENPSVLELQSACFRVRHHLCK